MDVLRSVWLELEGASGEDSLVAVHEFHYERLPELRSAAIYRPHHFTAGGRIIVWQTLVIAVVPALCTALGAWLGSRNGRKVHIRVGDIEAEAQTQKQVEKLLTRALEIQATQRKRKPSKSRAATKSRKRSRKP